MRAKHPHSESIRKKRVIFFELGLIIAISISVYAFNYSQTVTETYINPEPIDLTFEKQLGEFKIIPEGQPQPQTAKPKAKEIIVRKVVDVFKVVDDDEPDPNKDLKVDLNFDTDPVVRQEIPLPQPKAPTQPKAEWGAQVMPEYKGGTSEMFRFIQNNIQYPEYERSNGNEGKVMVTFVVEKDGTITHVKILRSAGMFFDAEAMRIVEMMPRWNPGKNNGQPARVRFNLPFTFELN